MNERNALPTSMTPDANMKALAQRLADAAGDILRRYFRTSVTIDRKSDASPVTLADREAEAAMRALIEETYPEHGIIGEEYGNIRSHAAFQWILDPVDGTRSFIAGYPLFTTLIALTHSGVPVLGIIDQAVSRERWTGVAGQATMLGTTQQYTRKLNGLAQAVIATTSIDYFTSQQAQQFSQLKQHCGNVSFGGDAYAYAMLASGQIDIVVDAGLKPYDYCALKTIIEGAGGIITGWDGKPITLACDGRVIASANNTLHQQALTYLQSAI